MSLEKISEGCEGDPVAAPSAPEKPKPPPYTPFYAEPPGDGGDSPAVRRISADSHPNVPSPTTNHNISIVSPMILSPSQLQSIPLTLYNPANETDDPFGLAPLASIDHVRVWREGGEFVFADALGRRVLSASEDVSCGARMMGKNRPFEITVTDHAYKELFSIRRPAGCNSFLVPACLPRVDVSSHSRGVFGCVRLRWAAFHDVLTVHAGDDVSALCHVKRRRVPLMGSNRADRDFKIFDADGKVQIGKFLSRVGPPGSDAISASGAVGVSFPKSLDVSLKAILMAALFLLKALFFE